MYIVFQFISGVVFGIELLTFEEIGLEAGKKCALIAVDEILEHCYEVMKPFWQEVKTEIELL